MLCFLCFSDMQYVLIGLGWCFAGFSALRPFSSIDSQIGKPGIRGFRLVWGGPEIRGREES